MMDIQNKLIPALVYKKTEKIFDIYTFDKDVRVNNFHSSLEESLLDKVVYDTKRKIVDGASVEKFVSSVSIKPVMKIKHHGSRIVVRHQPFKKVIYRSSVTLFGGFLCKQQPFVEVSGPKVSDVNNNGEHEDIENESCNVWKTVANIEI